MTTTTTTTTTATLTTDARNAITDAASDAGQEIGRAWLRAAQESGDRPDPAYDFSGDWQIVRDAVRAAAATAGMDADDLWGANAQQPTKDLHKAIWAAAESGYLLAIDDA